MCLVSYTPTKEGYLLCSNRDESPLRHTNVLTKKEISDLLTIVSPMDTRGGSWIFSASDGRTICVLNGAFKRHRRLVPYRLSRGIMMRHYFDYPSTKDFIANFDFNNIEPFTMVIVDSKGIYEFRWDGFIKHVEILNKNKAYNWSSCTLYDDEVILKRQVEFNRLLSESSSRINELKKIHLEGKIGDSTNDFVMDRNGIVSTISLTQVEKLEKSISIYFNDLISGESRELHLDLDQK